MCCLAMSVAWQDNEIPGARECNIKHAHGVEFVDPVERLSFSIKQRPNSSLDLRSIPRFPVHRAEDDDRKFQAFGLVNRQERYSTLREGVVNVFIFGFFEPEKSVEIGREEKIDEGLAGEHLPGENWAVFVVEACQILRDEAEVADGSFVFALLGEAVGVQEAGESAELVEEVEDAPVQGSDSVEQVANSVWAFLVYSASNSTRLADGIESFCMRRESLRLRATI